MATDRFEIRVSLTKLLIGLAVTIVPLSLAGLYSMTRTQQSMEAAVGNHFRTIADMTAAQVSQFITDRVVAVGMLALEPAIIDAAVTANRAYAGATPDAMQRRIQEIERIWNTPAAEPMVRAVLNSRASRLLSRHRDLDRRFLRITVTDQNGATIAATHKTLDYYQADEDFWQGIHASGRGAISVTDILYDEVTKSHYVGIGVPVMAEESNTFIGAVDALVEVSALFPILTRQSIGSSGRILLVKADGTLIHGPNATLSMKLKSAEYAVAQEAMASRGNRGFVYAPVAGVPSLVGFAGSGLEEHYPNLRWTVVVAQDAQEAFAPTRVIVRLNALLVILGFALLTFLAVYFSLHRRREYLDIQTPPAATASGA